MEKLVVKPELMNSWGKIDSYVWHNGKKTVSSAVGNSATFTLHPSYAYYRTNFTHQKKVHLVLLVFVIRAVPLLEIFKFQSTVLSLVIAWSTIIYHIVFIRKGFLSLLISFPELKLIFFHHTSAWKYRWTPIAVTFGFQPWSQIILTFCSYRMDSHDTLDRQDGQGANASWSIFELESRKK